MFGEEAMSCPPHPDEYYDRSARPGERSELTFVARQPILDEARQVFGYELLYRAAEADAACVADTDVASARVLTDASDHRH